MKKIFLLAAASLLLFSCDQTLVENEFQDSLKSGTAHQIKNVDGILMFDDLNDFFRIADSVGMLKTDEFQMWEEEVNFSSRYSEYKKLVSLDERTSEIVGSSSIIFNTKDSTYDVNSVNVNIAKLTNRDGLVIIGSAAYLFSAKEVAFIDGYTQECLKDLISTTRSGKVLSKPVVEMTPLQSTNARVAPWELSQDGNEIYGVEPGSSNSNFMHTRLVGRYYEVPNPTNPFFIIKRQSIDLLASFYHRQAFGGLALRVPQKYEASWSFEAFYAPCGVCNLQYNPVSGQYVESGVASIDVTIFDNVQGDIKNLSVPISASAYNYQTGATVVSSTTFLFSY